MRTLGMIKPEGLKYAKDIEARIIGSGLEIRQKKRIRLSEEQFEMIYGNASIPRVYDALKHYMTHNQVIVLMVSGDNAVERLLKLRGCSNAADADQGTIRGDYARNQDYNTLYERGQFAKNVFHAADPEEAYIVDVFFRGEK